MIRNWSQILLHRPFLKTNPNPYYSHQPGLVGAWPTPKAPFQNLQIETGSMGKIPNDGGYCFLALILIFKF